MNEYLNLFCVQYYYFLFFSFEHFLRGQFFFWDQRSHGPVDFVDLTHPMVYFGNLGPFDDAMGEMGGS